MKLLTVNRENILVNNNYKIRFFDPSKQLITSIEKNVLNPLIVYKQQDEFLLLDGFRRIEFSNKNVFNALVFDNLKDAFTKTVELNMVSSPYLETEKAKALFIAINSCGFSKEEALSNLNGLLGLARKLEVVNQYLEIFNLEITLLNFLISKKAPVSLFALFLRESKEDCQVLANLFNNNKLSVSQIRKIYDLMFYIRKREGVSFSEILKNLKEKDSLEKQLTKRRFPIFSSLKQELDTLLKDYKGFLSFPDDFEDTKLTFSTKIRTLNDINNAIAVLEKLKEDKRFYEFVEKL